MTTIAVISVKSSDELVTHRPQIKVVCASWEPTEDWLKAHGFKFELMGASWWVNGEPDSVVCVDLRWSLAHKEWTLQDPDTRLPVYPKSEDDILNIMKAIGVK